MGQLTSIKTGKRGRRRRRGEGRGGDPRLARKVKPLDIPKYSIRGIGDFYESARTRSRLPVSPSQAGANPRPRLMAAVQLNKFGFHSATAGDHDLWRIADGEFRSISPPKWPRKP